jgi:hypothetical protein
MPHSKLKKRLTLESPAIYQINVQGNLEGSWWGRLRGMRIVKCYGKDSVKVTTPVGRVRDHSSHVFTDVIRQMKG